MSRTGLSPSDIAESFRDRCGDGSVEWVYTPTQTWVLLDAADMLDENDKMREQGERLLDKTLELGTENAKLRELARDMRRAIVCLILLHDEYIDSGEDELVALDLRAEELGVEV